MSNSKKTFLSILVIILFVIGLYFFVTYLKKNIKENTSPVVNACPIRIVYSSEEDESQYDKKDYDSAVPRKIVEVKNRAVDLYAEYPDFSVIEPGVKDFKEFIDQDLLANPDKTICEQITNPEFIKEYCYSDNELKKDSFSLKYSIKKFDENYISIEFKKYINISSATDGDTSTFSYNYDRKNKKEIEFKDIFPDINKVKEKLQNCLLEKSMSDYYSDVFSTIFGTDDISKLQFSLAGEDIIIYTSNLSSFSKLIFPISYLK